MPVVATEGEVDQTVKAIDGWFEMMFGAATPSDIFWILLKTALIILACLVIKRIVLHSFAKIMTKTSMERGMQKFLRTMANILLWLAVIMVLASSLNINPAPLLATFGVLGLALSLAAQDSLSNLAGGINILLSRPFVVGDYIEIDADGGTVHDIGMIHTTLQTVDNRRVMLPNSKVMSARVINYSSESDRRVEIAFSVSYDAEIVQVQKAALALLDSHPEAYTEPEPCVVVTEYGERGIVYSLRVWCERDAYWDLYFALMQELKPALDAGGVDMTYPHLNVHIKKDKE